VIIPGYGNVWKSGSPSLSFASKSRSYRRRNYPLKKIQENNEAEIMQVVLEDARSSYPAEIVVELKSESTEDLEANVTRIVDWIVVWKNERASEA
jgi:adenylate kinase